MLVSQDNPFPLPILSTHGETTADKALQVGFKILAVVRGVGVEDVYISL